MQRVEKNKTGTFVRDARLCGFITRKCPVCGKEFDSNSNYKYKRNVKIDGRKRTDYYCSYTCYNKGDPK